MAQFFTRFIKGMVEDVVVEKLSNSKTFQNVAVNTMKASESAQATLQDLAKDAASREQAVGQLKETAGSFWSSLKAEIAKDLGALKEPEAVTAGSKPAASGDSARKMQ